MALYFLQRLRMRFVAARRSSGHRLFVSVLTIASKVICDNTYSGRSWCRRGPRRRGRRSAASCTSPSPPGLSPSAQTHPGLQYSQHYTLPTPATGPFAHPKPTTSSIGSAIWMFGPLSQTMPSPPMASAIPRKPSHSPERPVPSRQSSGDTYPSPPGSPGTPSLSHSNSVSPAASMFSTSLRRP
jgi:hypothetical protein